ncbi:MAG: phosphate ABC transporter substrate-binding protein, partial [Gammaproteobacteria bacterium]
MQFNLTVCPDFKPDLISGWFFFNTWFQKQINQGVHLEIYQTFAEQDKAIEDKRVDIIYANPCDVARLVRDEGFIPIAKPKEKPDEAIIASLKEGSIHGFDDIPEQVRIAHTSARDVNTIGMIMLEPADLEA